MYAVKINELSSSYLPNIIDNSNMLKIRKHKLISLCGKNSKQKKEFLLILSGLIRADKINGEILNFNIENVDSFIKKTLYIDNARIGYDKLSVIDNLNFFYQCIKSEKNDNIAEILDYLNLSDKSSKTLSALTNYELTKFKLAFCLLNEELELILINDISQNLSYSEKSEFWHYLQEITTKGKTIICAVSDLAEAEFSHELIYMNDNFMVHDTIEAIIKNSKLLAFSYNGRDLAKYKRLLENIQEINIRQSGLNLYIHANINSKDEIYNIFNNLPGFSEQRPNLSLSLAKIEQHKTEQS